MVVNYVSYVADGLSVEGESLALVRACLEYEEANENHTRLF